MGGVFPFPPAAAEGAAAVFADVVLFPNDGVVEPASVARHDLEHFHDAPPDSLSPPLHGRAQLLRHARSATALRAGDNLRGPDDPALLPPRDGGHLGPADAFPHLVRDRG